MKIIVTLCVVIIFCGLGYYFLFSKDNQPTPLPVSTYEFENHDSHKGHDMTVTSERDFIEHMIPHHQEAVDTAKVVLASVSTSPETRTLAEAIVTAQSTEIELMKSWYREWYQEEYVDDGSYRPMMRIGVEADSNLEEMFLTDMIVHHESAIRMAENVVPFVTKPELEKMVRAVIDTQTAEIELMRSLLN